MKRVTVTAVAAGVVLGVALLLACNGSNGSDAPVDDTETVEVGVPCYKGDKFIKWDDDCADDGLTIGPAPVRTSGGMQTSGPLKPAPKVSVRR